MLNIIDSRYIIVKKLGLGSMGAVYLANDTLYNDNQIAIKVIHEDILNRKNLHIFKKEFEVMTRLKHPNLVRVYDFGHDLTSNNYYITMEYIHGRTMAGSIKIGENISCDDMMTIVIDLLRSLEFMHSRSIIHRDIKPGNIIIKDGRAKLMDFGLADLNGAEKKFKGTLVYTAPEQITNNIDSRVDIFSLGVTLYEFFTGIQLFGGLSSIDILKYLHYEKFYNEYQDKMFARIDNKVVRKVIKRMTAFNPDSRFDNALEIIDIINENYIHTYSYETKDTGESYILGGEFVGRDNEFTEILTWLKDQKENFLIVYGEAGIGKSRLMNEFKKYCQVNDVLFIEGSFHENVSRVLGPFISIINECLLDISEESVNRYGSVLKKIVPAHQRLIGIKVSPIEDPRAEQKIILSTILDFLLSYVSEKNRKVTIYLNDVQWADDASLAVLEALLKRLSLKSDNNLLKVAVTSRNETIIEPKTPFRKIKLSLFSRDHIVAYIQAIFGTGRIGDMLYNSIDEINKKVGGNPFFLQELIKSLVETRHIMRTSKFWELIQSIRTIDIPENIEYLILSRLERLSLNSEKERILRILALLNREITWDELNRIIDTDYDYLLKLEHVEIIASEIIDEKLYFRISHDLISKSIVDEIIDKKELHGYIASKLVKIHKKSLSGHIEEIAYHFHYSNDIKNAQKYLEMAGDHAKEVFENKKAIQIFNSLLEILNDPEKIASTQLKLGEIYIELCQWDNGRESLDKAIVIADEIGLDRIYAQSSFFLGRGFLHSDRLYDALEAYSNALVRFEKIGDKTGMSQAYNGLGSCHNQLFMFDKALEYHKLGLAVAEENNDEENAAYITGNIGVLSMNMGDYEYSITCNLKALERALKHGKLTRVAFGYGMVGRAHGLLHRYELARTNLEKAIQLAIDIDSSVLLANFYIYKAEVQYLMEEYEEAYENVQLGLEHSRANGLKTNTFNGEVLAAKINYCRGNRDEALQYFSQRLANSDNDIEVATLYYEIWKINHNEVYRSRALTIFNKLHNEIPNTRYKQYIHELTM